MAIVRRHPGDGHDILSDINFLAPVAEVALQHHERLDRSGYPQGLTGEEIILVAKILAVADVFEALISHRPYRPAYNVEEALKIIEEEQQGGEGPKYYTEALDALVKLVDDRRLP